MKKFTTDNGFTMVECSPLNFKEESTYADGSGDKVYTISVGNMSDMYTCIYFPNTNILTIASITYSNQFSLSFYCTSFEQASIIVYSFGIGTFDANIFDDTISTLKK